MSVIKRDGVAPRPQFPDFESRGDFEAQYPSFRENLFTMLYADLKQWAEATDQSAAAAEVLTILEQFESLFKVNLPGPVIRERLARVSHEIWSHWMRYQFSQCGVQHRSFNGKTQEELIIPADKVERWTRQLNTLYDDLTDKEQESDREQADKILAALKSW